MSNLAPLSLRDTHPPPLLLPPSPPSEVSPPAAIHASAAASPNNIAVPPHATATAPSPIAAVPTRQHTEQRDLQWTRGEHL